MSKIIAIIKLVRVKQWTKNAFVFMPLIFSLSFFDRHLVVLSFVTAFAFCLLSSAVYVFNDIIDRDMDKNHPVKKDRPIASGKISIQTGYLLVFLFFLSSLTISFLLNAWLLIPFSVYFVMNIVYALWLKHEVILDVIIIACGFLIRVISGVIVIDVSLSSWMILATFFVALFLGFAKRRSEIITLESKNSHRPVLDSYSEELVNYLIIISVTMTLVTYSLYTIDQKTISLLGTDKMIYTVPFVVFGMFRYMYLAFIKHEGGDPSELLIKDKKILFAVVLWGLTVLSILTGIFPEIQ